MKSKLKNICIVVERNTKIEKIVNDYFLGFEVTADKDFLERQIVNWSCFDENNEHEAIFFKVYVQRYLSHSENSKKLKKFKSNDVSALLVVRVNDEDKNETKGFVELSFHETFDDMNLELIKVQYLNLIEMIDKKREHALSIN